MGLFNFGGSSSQPASQASQQATTSTQQANADQVATQQASGAGQQPATSATTQESSPFDKYSQLWQTGTTDEGQAGTKQLVSMDPAKLAEATGRLNFAAGLKPEHVQAVLSGGENAAQAFQSALNTVAQQAFQTAMIGSSKLIEQALQSQRQELLGEIPGIFKNQMLNSQAFEENPALSHPSVRPLIEVLQTQFAAKFPEASNAELRKMAADYLTQTASLVSGKQFQDPQPQPAGGFGTSAVGAQPDWDNFFSTR